LTTPCRDISPDGRWLAYASNDAGRSEIYVRPFPDVNAGRWQVSTAGGASPRWSRDGRELFYMKEGKVTVVSVTATAPPLAVGRPTELFPGPYATSFDVSADGQRFLMMKNAP
jgi:serine/threonine-protein kinase